MVGRGLASCFKTGGVLNIVSALERGWADRSYNNTIADAPIDVSACPGVASFTAVQSRTW